MSRTEQDTLRGGVVLVLGSLGLLTALIPFEGFVYTWPLPLLAIWLSVPALRVWRTGQARPQINIADRIRPGDDRVPSRHSAVDDDLA